MARGSIAKLSVENVIKEAFGENFVGISDKKLYVWADDGGEKVQIAITLTCPKVGIETGATPTTNSFIEGGLVGNYSGTPVIEMTPEEEQNIQTLLEKLGL